MMIAGVFALWLVFQLVAEYFQLWKENCRQIAATGQGFVRCVCFPKQKNKLKENGYIEN